MSGIVYFKKSPSEYYNNMIGYDYTKNVSLVGAEIDNNFYALEGRDLYGISAERDQIIFEFVDGSTKSVRIEPYKAGCGIDITECGNDNPTISVRTIENGAVSCFNGEFGVNTACGLTVTHEVESCEGFRMYLMRMFGGYVGGMYINSLMKINGSFYGGVTSPDACYEPDCKNDQFYGDYLNYIKAGSLSIDVCGIECLDNGTARIVTDNATITLDNCELKVKYGCGLTVSEGSEEEYITWLYVNWDGLEGTSGASVDDYVAGETEVSGEVYGNGGDYTHDQFYGAFITNEQYPKLVVHTNECGGIVCDDNGLSIDYGCGLGIGTCDPHCEEYEVFVNRFFNDDPKNPYQCDEYWQEHTYYNTFIRCLNSGVLHVLLQENSGLSCINGKLRLNASNSLTIEGINPDYNGFISFLTDNAILFVSDKETMEGYIHQETQINGEYFGGDECQGCTPPEDIWFNDQFICDYLSYVNGGLLSCNCGKGTKGGELRKGVDGDNSNEHTWEELVTMRNESSLVPGMWYVISDYTPETRFAYTDNTQQFKLAVNAITPNVFSNNAKAIATDESEYTQNKLSKWELFYELTPDDGEYEWYGKYCEYTPEGSETTFKAVYVEEDNIDDSDGTILYSYKYFDTANSEQVTVYKSENTNDAYDANGEVVGAFDAETETTKGVIYKIVDDRGNTYNYDFVHLTSSDLSLQETQEQQPER